MVIVPLPAAALALVTKFAAPRALSAWIPRSPPAWIVASSAYALVVWSMAVTSREPLSAAMPLTAPLKR
ncbi:hypothetical protein KBTX_03316 [wastewater metagenome]|uniref:Uncharacterized protein n=2 Tax=unclassified sequences TaxID=12908 RepID=A0A5B8RG16_9ZZZZ|nr:hypothetical protein KBTEX_03316 [uncultured organism]